MRFLEGRIALQNRVTEIRPAIPLRESDRHGENNSPKGLGYSLVPVPLTPSSWRWWGDGIGAAEVPEPVVPPRDRWAGVNNNVDCGEGLGGRREYPRELRSRGERKVFSGVEA